MVDWLLGNGAFHQPLNVYQDSATYVAVYYNQIEILDVLKKHGCDCNMPSKYTNNKNYSSVLNYNEDKNHAAV